MPYNVTTEGMDELSRMLGELGERAQGVAAVGLYEGAGVMADAVSRAVGKIATEPFRYAKRGQQRLPSPEEKALVAGAAHGIAKFSKKGVSVDTVVGFRNAGYGQLGSKTKPIPQVANAINSGTSFMKKQPFFRQAVNGAKGAALAATEGKIREVIDSIMKE